MLPSFAVVSFVLQGLSEKATVFGFLKGLGRTPDDAFVRLWRDGRIGGGCTMTACARESGIPRSLQFGQLLGSIPH